MKISNTNKLVRQHEPVLRAQDDPSLLILSSFPLNVNNERHKNCVKIVIFHGKEVSVSIKIDSRTKNDYIEIIMDRNTLDYAT